MGPSIERSHDGLSGAPRRWVLGEVAGELFRTAWGKVTSEAGGAARRHRCASWGKKRTRQGSSTTGSPLLRPRSGGTSHPDPAGDRRRAERYWYARNQAGPSSIPMGSIYSRILDEDGNVLTYVDEDHSTRPYVGRNPSEGGRVTPAGHISDKPCAEAQVLTVMEGNIRRDDERAEGARSGSHDPEYGRRRR